MDTELTEIDDPFALTRAEPVTGTRTFTDPRQPGKKITLTFRAEVDHSVVLRVRRVAAKYYRDFIQGRERVDPRTKEKTRVPVPLRAVGGRSIQPDEDLFYQIASVEALHVPGEKGRKFDVFQWAALSVTMPSAFGEIVNWAGEMLELASGRLGDDELPNDSGAE